MLNKVSRSENVDSPDPNQIELYTSVVLLENLSSARMEQGVSFVGERIKRARGRLAVLTSTGRKRDMREVWEAYFDLEEAILMARIIFGGFDRPGKIRKLPEREKFSDEEIRASFMSAENSLSLAENNLANRRGDETVETLRKSRDLLKIMLLADARRKGSKSNQSGSEMED